MTISESKAFNNLVEDLSTYEKNPNTKEAFKSYAFSICETFDR